MINPIENSIYVWYESVRPHVHTDRKYTLKWNYAISKQGEGQYNYSNC